MQTCSKFKNAYRRLVKRYHPDYCIETGEKLHQKNETRRGLFAELDDLLEGWVPGIYTHGRGASRHKDLYVELVLSPAEAEVGGIIPLKVPVERTCAGCEGSGFAGMFSCEACNGSGKLVEYDDIKISIPSGVNDGTVVKLPLGDVGLPGINLTVLVTVAV